MGGSYATSNFHAAEVFTKVMVAEAVKWGWDGYTMETEIKYTEHAAMDMARFFDTFAGALHTLNKTLAVITKDTFKGHREIGGSAVDFIIPTQYAATGVVPGYIHDQVSWSQRANKPHPVHLTLCPHKCGVDFSIILTGGCTTRRTSTGGRAAPRLRSFQPQMLEQSWMPCVKR
jgi:hypothetical protein